MATVRRTLAWLGALTLIAAGCAPAATATPTPVPTRAAASAATPGAIVSPTATPRLAATATPTPAPARPPDAKAKAGGFFRMLNDNREPISWDRWTRKDGGRDNSTRTYLVFSQLATQMASLDNPCQVALRGELAESWRWVDATTLEMKLHSGVRFHNKAPVNGREMTAEDVVWSATQFIKGNTIRGMERAAVNVARIEAVDRYTVRFNLKAPSPSFLTEGLTNEYGALILPREVVDKEGRWSDPDKSYIGTGPFMFKEHRGGVRTSFVKNPDYFKKGLPYLDAVDYMIIPDISTQIAGLRSHAVDMVYNVPSAMALALKKASGIKVTACPQLAAMPGRLYFRTDKPPLNDVRVRRAVQMAIDRQGLVDAVLLGQGVTAPHFPKDVNHAFVGLEELPPEVAQWAKYDPVRARQVLAEAGYPKGFDASIKMNNAYTTPYPEMGEAIVGFLRAIGINARANTVTSVEFISFTNTADFKDDLMAFGLIASLNTSTAYFDTWHSKGPLSQNRSRINDPELDKMIDQLLLETDDNKYSQLYKKLETRLIDQAWEPTAGAFPFQFSAMQDYVRDFAGPHQYYAATYLERMWLDK